MLSELSHLQEAMDQLEKHSSDPYSLPPASEQVRTTVFSFSHIVENTFLFVYRIIACHSALSQCR